MRRTHTTLTFALTLCLLGTAVGSPASAQVTGDTFDIAYGDAISDGVPEPGAGNIETGGSVDVYRFESEAGDIAIFDVLSGSNSIFRWRLDGPGGDVVFDSAYTDRSIELVDSGTYSLTVYGITSTAVGTYSFRLLLTPPAQQFSIEFEDTVSDGVPEPGAGNIEVPGAQDIYEFDGTAGQTAIFDALAGPTSGLRLILRAPDGTELLNVIYADREATLPQSGTYTVSVQGLTVTGVGMYSFQLLAVPPQIDEFTIAFGDTVADGVPGTGAGNIEQPGSVDRYVFDAIAGQTAVFETLTGPTSGLRWVLSAPDGLELFNAIYSDEERLLLQTGTYVLTVTGLTFTGVGTYSFRLVERPPNNDPVAVDDEAETDSGVPVIVDVLANDSDPDGDDLSVDAVTQPANGTTSIDGAEVTYTPESSFWGMDTFGYTVADGSGGMAHATVTVTVHEPANTPPDIEDMADQNSTVGDSVTLQLEAEDPDGDTLTYSADGLPPGLGIDPGSGEIAGIIADGADAASPYLVEVVVTDSRGAPASSDFQWIVHPPEHPVVKVEIDILMPCIFVNGFGVIPVVIYGNEQVDGRDVDLATVELEGMPVARVWHRHVAVVADYNRDGIDDVLVMISDTGAVPLGASSATLTGALDDGTTFAGTDAVCVRRAGR